MAVKKLTAGEVVEKARVKRRVEGERSWVEQLANRLELSVFDLWLVGLTIAGIGALYLIGEVAARLSGIH
ncbi:hypothetical protein EDD75_1398 [Thermodesulfitimonas autotrophica]|uniref:Uncharacterized protein n=1 Tax=Thermodesulfitimonas autotrophica TaxID=1894989 RepID=A0A3N5AQG4_9THEO|nr:hypothetical protein [Thermodesulfitimonas autotrophica]RPF47123.1 hypothetical protein EDD75_1398 [Thermodesulfitimonas autotrophica]